MRFSLRLTRVQVGAVFLIGTLAAGLALFQRTQILTAVRPGEVIEAEFSSGYKLRPYNSEVKVAGVPVGLVTAVAPAAGGFRGTVTMKVQPGIAGKLGTEPSAAIRPNTLLGGVYYVSLEPGGRPGRLRGPIPAARTSVPVELDRVLEVLTREPQQGLQTTVQELDRSLRLGGGDALKELLDAAPPALGPGAVVFDAARGTEPQNDLAETVEYLGNVGRELTAPQAELAAVVDDAGVTAQAVAAGAQPLADAVGPLPSALPRTRAALKDLRATLAELRRTAKLNVETARELDRLLAEAESGLPDARRLVADLRPLLADLRPAFADAAPALRSLEEIVEDLDGEVIDRVRSPIVATLNARGFEGEPTRLYEEVGFLFSALAGVLKYTDENGAALNFNAGLNGNTLTATGLPPPVGGITPPSGALLAPQDTRRPVGGSGEDPDG